MSSVAISLFVFGIYLVASGLAYAFVPNAALALFGQPPTYEPWIRISGALLLGLGYYYIQVARADLRSFYPWTVVARVVVGILFIVFVVAQWAPITLAMFAVIDMLGALWTFLTFRASEAGGA